LDFTYCAAEDRIYAVDQSDSVWTWQTQDTERKAVKADVPFASLASVGTDAYIYDGSTHELYKLSPDSAEKRADGYAEFLARGTGGKSLLVVENDHTVGTPDAIRRLPPAPIPKTLEEFPVIDRFDTTDVQAVVERSEGELVYSSSGFDGCLVKRGRDGKDRVLAHGLGRPGALAEAGGFLYCLDLSGRLYRLTPKNEVQTIDLIDIGFGDRDTARHLTDRGMQSPRPDLLWIAAGDGVFELDLTHARWQAFIAH
jgi:hypothetical protein